MGDPKPLPSETAFIAALDRIAMDRREPTEWESGCLYAALCAMAVGDHRTAEQKVALCTLGSATLTPQVQVFPPLTLDDLRDALARLEKPVIQARRDKPRRNLTVPILTIITLLATFVMFHP